MSTMIPLPNDHPLRVAFAEYQQTDEYKNTKRWALNPEHVDGSLWAVFETGWRLSREAEQKRCIEVVWKTDLPFGRNNQLLNEIVDAILAETRKHD